VKSPSRTHHSRVNVARANVQQADGEYHVTVTFTFDPWDHPSVLPIGYAADALTAVNAVIEAGLESLDAEHRKLSNLDED